MVRTVKNPHFPDGPFRPDNYAPFLKGRTGRRARKPVDNVKTEEIKLSRLDWNLLMDYSARAGVAIGEMLGRLLAPALAALRKGRDPQQLDESK